MARMMLVGPDLVARNAVAAGPGYEPPNGMVAIASDTAMIGDVYDPVMGTFSGAVVPLAGRRAAAAAKIEARKAALLAQGAPYAGRKVAMDDSSRIAIGGMLQTALMVESGAIHDWPESYAQGWIAADNSRIPLPQPADGIAMGASVFRWQSSLAQFTRTAKDAAATGENPEALVDGLDWSPWG